MPIELVTGSFAPDVNAVAMTPGRPAGGLRRRVRLVHVWHAAGRGKDSGGTNLSSVGPPGYKEVRVRLPGRAMRSWESGENKTRPDVVCRATEGDTGLCDPGRRLDRGDCWSLRAGTMCRVFPLTDLERFTIASVILLGSLAG